MYTNNSKKELVELGTIACLSSYLNKINKIHQLQADKILYYRGHYNDDFVLKSSVGRLENYTEELEKELFAKFSAQYYSYTNLRYDKNIDKLFLAQHYGLPTRLLDWTLNPLVALFFACYDDKNLTRKNGEVLVKYVDKQTPIEEKRNVEPLGQDDFSNMLIIPDYFDQRLRNQSAAFTIQQNPNEVEAKSGYRIIVSRKQRILKELANIGINVDYIYPTLDRMCERIKKESNY